MLLRTHLVFSIAFGIFLLEFMEVGSPEIFFLCLIFATAFVDIDTKNSKLGRKIYFRPIQFFTKHRGMIHSFLFAILVSVVISYFHRWAGVGFFAGYVSHLFLDFLTKEGIAIFWPISSKRFGLGIKVGGGIEEVLFISLVAVDIIFVWNLF
jgi:inner membrane protein